MAAKKTKTRKTRNPNTLPRSLSPERVLAMMRAAGVEVDDTALLSLHSETKGVRQTGPRRPNDQTVSTVRDYIGGRIPFLELCTGLDETAQRAYAVVGRVVVYHQEHPEEGILSTPRSAPARARSASRK